MVLRQLDMHMQKNEVGGGAYSLHHIHKLIQNGWPICKS